LDKLPSTMLQLWCENNQLTGLPKLPFQLYSLHTYNNLFEYDFEPTLRNIREYNETIIVFK
jgi:protease II